MLTAKLFRWFNLVLLISLILVLPATLLSADPKYILPDGFPKPFEAEGQVFEISSNLRLESTQPIRLTADIVTQTHLSFVISPIKTTHGNKTTLTLSGSEGLGHRHQDGFFVEEHQPGQITWEQDIKTHHHIYFLTEISTINIWGRDDYRDEVVSKGVGIWLDATTCQLTKNINESIVIQADDITLDGDGYSIFSYSATPYGYGIYLFGRTGVTVKNCTVTRYATGIFLYGGTDNTIVSNSAYSNASGITLFGSFHNDVKLNKANRNEVIGIHISGPWGSPVATYHTISGNVANSNTVGIVLLYVTHNIISDNTVDSNDFAGIHFAECSDNTVANNELRFNRGWGSYDPNRGWGGINLQFSNNNTITGNVIESNDYGMSLLDAHNNSIHQNDIYENDDGLNLITSGDNRIYHNNIWQNTGYQAYSVLYGGPPYPPILEAELSYQGEGNWWGRTTEPGFMAGVDSNDSQVVDSYPYIRQDSWQILGLTINSPQTQEYLNLEAFTIDFNITGDLKNYQVYLDGSQFIDGILLDQGVEIPLVNLSLGQHTLAVIAFDEAEHQAGRGVTFKVVPPVHLVDKTTTDIQTLIDDPGVPAKARQALEKSLAMLIGQNQGQANNGALDKLTDGDLIAAFTGIWQAIKELAKAEQLGVPTQTIQEDLCSLVKEIVQLRLAQAEALYGPDHPDVIKIRQAYEAGLALYDAGDYAEAAHKFRFGQQKIALLDQAEPIIIFISPQPNGFFNTPTPELLVEYTDKSTTIHVSNIRVWIDGIDYTTQAAITSSVLRLIPPSLAEGMHTLTLSVSDTAEPPNTSIVSISFGIDLTPPSLTIDYPTEGITLTHRDEIYCEISYSDGASGVNLESFEVLLNGQEITEVFDQTATYTTYHPDFYTLEGIDKGWVVYTASLDGFNELIVRITDSSGNAQEQTRHFEVTQGTLEGPFASGQHLIAWLDPADWSIDIHLRILETPTPCQVADHVAGGPIGEITQGTLTLSYTDVYGLPIKEAQIIEINNITRVISHEGTTVTLLKEIFGPLPSPPGEENIIVLMDFSCAVTILLNSPPFGCSRSPDEKGYKTDKGTSITSWDRNIYIGELTPQSIANFQRKLDETWHIKNRIKKVMDPTTSYNCFGWAFTCGNKWLPSAVDIKNIRNENGYKKRDIYTQPAEGDLVLYYKGNQLRHVGIVTKIYYGKITVTSKFGPYGGYEHDPYAIPGDDPETPEEDSYGDPVYYYLTGPRANIPHNKIRHTLLEESTECGCLGWEALIFAFIIILVKRGYRKSQRGKAILS